MAATKFDSEKPRLGLISPLFKADMARVLAAGEAKYGEGNYLMGDAEFRDRLLDAIERHTDAIRRGESLDPDDGISHAAHIATGAMMVDMLNRKLSLAKLQKVSRWTDGGVPHNAYLNRIGSK